MAICFQLAPEHTVPSSSEEVENIVKLFFLAFNIIHPFSRRAYYDSRRIEQLKYIWVRVSGVFPFRSIWYT